MLIMETQSPEPDFYLSLIELMEEGVFVLNEAREIVYFNAALLKVLGLTESELRRGEVKVIYDDGRPVPLDEVPAYKTLRTEDTLSGVVLGVVRKDMNVSWVSISTKILKKGVVMCTVSDVTAAKVKEKLLRESEGKLRTFIQEAPVGIMFTNEGQSCTFVNKTWCEISGQSVDECFGTGWPKAVHGDDARELFQGWKRLTGLGHKVRLEIRFVHPDDSVVWATVKAAPMFDDSGTRLGFLWTASDITERRKAEAERDRFFTLSMDMFCLVNTRGYLTRVNPSFTECLGWTPEDLYSKPLVDFVHPDDKLDTQEEVAKLSNGYEEASFENRVRAKNGHWRWLEWSCSAPEDGIIYAVARDITEKKRAQEALKKLAHTDQLTGLHNRTTLMSQLSAKIMQAEEYGVRVAVLFIDLDDFKVVNDTHGHDSGDIVIREVGSRLLSSVRRSDTVARLGGDEYVVVLDNVDDNAVEQVALKILAQVGEPLTLPNGHVVYPHASIGVSTFPEDGNDPEELVKLADKAMYSSKRAGGHRCS
jgi:diguanylate cyclase (GGDEF)-like protein/PAS domain S-box-containing protein